jgi:cell division protein FtsL
MTRLNLMLLLAVLVSALYLVRTQYESRSLFVELDRANAQARKLEVDNERLQVERRTQATPLRVEKLAKEQLQMRSSSPAITQYVTMQAQAVAAAPTQAPAGGASGGRGRSIDNARPVQ